MLKYPYNKNQIYALFVLYIYFVSRIYMFRAYYCPSSGGTTVCVQQLVRVILKREINVSLTLHHRDQYSETNVMHFFRLIKN
jgi:hypothetical protein